MARTYRHDNGLNRGRDDKPHGAKCAPDSKHPNGFNTFLDDHGHYGAGGSRSMKVLATRARRNYQRRLAQNELLQAEIDPFYDEDYVLDRYGEFDEELKADAFEENWNAEKD